MARWWLKSASHTARTANPQIYARVLVGLMMKTYNAHAPGIKAALILTPAQSGRHPARNMGDAVDAQQLSHIGYQLQ
jgi:hypothetical protein